MTKDNLQAACEELNGLFGLDPAININAEDEVLIEKLKEAAFLVEPEDRISASTKKIFIEIGAHGFEGREIKVKKTVVEIPKKEEVEAEVIEEIVDDPDENEEDYEKADEVDENTVVDNTVDNTVDEVETAVPFKERFSRKVVAPTYSKNQALYDTMVKHPEGISKKDLVVEMEAAYVKNGGRSSIAGTKTAVYMYLPMLVLFGAVAEDNGKWFIVK